MPVPPTLTQGQRKLAAQRSLELRRHRADIKTWIGEHDPVMRLALSWQFPAAQGMKVYDLLRAIPGIGHGKAMKLLGCANVKHPERKTVKAFSDNQRERLFVALATMFHLDDAKPE